MTTEITGTVIIRRGSRFGRFEHERFLALPGSGPERVTQRYALWCADMVAAHAEHALRVTYQGRVQGWFLSAPERGGLHLALAMLHREASVSGLSLYEQALRAYAARGARIGFASFSVTNSPVHNVYARLGARFLATQGCWLHVNDAAR